MPIATIDALPKDLSIRKRLRYHRPQAVPVGVLQQAASGLKAGETQIEDGGPGSESYLNRLSTFDDPIEGMNQYLEMNGFDVGYEELIDIDWEHGTHFALEAVFSALVHTNEEYESSIGALHEGSRTGFIMFAEEGNTLINDAGFLDKMQLGFDIAGLYEGFGTVADIGSAGISAIKLDGPGVVASSASAVPVWGLLYGMEKVRRKFADIIGKFRGRQDDLLDGSFSLTERGWEGYPEGVPRPEGPFRLVKGDELTESRRLANSANRTIRDAGDLKGTDFDVHEIHPVKFGGSPVDPDNKIILDRSVHQREVTPWWNRVQRQIENGGG